MSRRGSRANPSTRRRSTGLRCERLEDRRLLVVGAFEVAPIVNPGGGFDGVVALDFSSVSTNTTLHADFTGALLSTGRHILTTAQAFDQDANGEVDDDLPNFQVVFEMNKQHYVVSIVAADANIVLAPDWDGDPFEGADLAIIELPFIAPFPAERYDIFRVPDDEDPLEINSLFTLVGYGETGTGDLGEQLHSEGIKRIGYNFFDDIEDVDNGELLEALFDDGPGSLGASEAGAGTFVDRGAPAFISNGSGPVIAGVYSIEIRDIFDDFSEFGTFDYYTRVSQFATFIDDTLALTSDIVLDMNFQPLGNDGTPDEIIAQRDPNDSTRLQLLVNGEEVWSDSLSHVTSLTINGSGDDDNIIIVGDFDKNITLNGRTGFDSFEYIGDTEDAATYTPDATFPGAGTLLVGIDLITFSNFEPMTVSALASFALITPAGVDNVLVETGPSPG
ncbi:MAG: hypothetical protein AB7U73_17395, partial [Pirellulales bacterium]